MRVFIGSDHGGYAMKEELKAYITSLGHTVCDKGTFSGDKAVDYPDIAEAVCTALLQAKKYCPDEEMYGVLVCGTGIGISIAANKIAGIRCALCHSHYDAAMTRCHNDANVIAFGGRTTGIEVAKEMVQAFLSTPFSGAHHTARVAKVAALEKKY